MPRGMRLCDVLVGCCALAMWLLVAPKLSMGQTVETLGGRDSMLVGDSIQVRIRVSAKRGADILFNEIPNKMGGMELLDTPRFDTLRHDDSGYVAQLSLALSSYDSGFCVVPRVPILVRYSGHEDTLYSEAIPILVSLLPHDTAVQEIYPIVGPREQGITWREIWPWLLLAVGVIAVALGVYFFVRWHRRKVKPGLSVVPDRPADEVALERLRSLRQTEAWRTAGVKLFYTQVADTLRYYLGCVWPVRAMEETTSSIVSQLERVPQCGPDRVEEIRRSLELADLVKFARYAPMETECIASVDAAIRIVDEIAYEQREAEAQRGLHGAKQAGAETQES